MFGESWQRNHAIIAPVVIFAICIFLWVLEGYDLRGALDSSIVEWAVMFYGAALGLFELGGWMFYAMAMNKRKEERLRNEGRAEGRAEMIKSLEDAASPEQAAVLRELMNKAGLQTNGR